MHRHIQTGDRGKTFINGELVEGAITEFRGDDQMTFRADIGTCYCIHRHNFVPDYKTEVGQTVDDNSSFSEKGGSKESERDNWVRDDAYFRWLNVGCPHGQDVRFWCEAERAFEGLEQ